VNFYTNLWGDSRWERRAGFKTGGSSRLAHNDNGYRFTAFAQVRAHRRGQAGGLPAGEQCC
jgi:hypothetical protein